MSANALKSRDFGLVSWVAAAVLVVVTGFMLWETFQWSLIDWAGFNPKYIWAGALAVATISAAYLGLLGAVVNVDMAREITSVLLTVVFGAIFWFAPEFGPADDASRDVVLLYASGVFFVLYGYLWLQGGSLAFTPLGASYKTTTNMFFSIVPFVGGVIAFVLHAVDVKAMSYFMIFSIAMTMAVSFYDTIVNGGLMARMNRYVSEYHNTRGTSA